MTVALPEEACTVLSWKTMAGLWGGRSEEHMLVLWIPTMLLLHFLSITMLSCEPR